MCSFSRPKAPQIIVPEPIPEAPPTIANATTRRDAPKKAKSVSEVKTASSSSMRKRRGRGSLRIPLNNIARAGVVNFPTS